MPYHESKSADELVEAANDRIRELRAEVARLRALEAEVARLRPLEAEVARLRAEAERADDLLVRWIPVARCYDLLERWTRIRMYWRRPEAIPPDEADESQGESQEIL